MIRIYQAVENPYTDANQYVVTLMNTISLNHNDVEWGWGISSFWSKDIFEYDIIHIHWPDLLLISGTNSLMLEKRLKKIKCSSKIKIVATCHNFVPHYCKDEDITRSYDVVYSNCDAIFHLGNVSMDHFTKVYPNINQYLLLHHTYDTFYSCSQNKKESRRLLGISDTSRCVLCFGTFRDDEEREMVKKLSRALRKDNIFIIAPSYKKINASSYLGKVSRKIKILYYRYVFNLIITGRGFNSVPANMTPAYFSASDIVMIPRKHILNSGNVTLAFYMGRVVIGPKRGNVGVILEESGNPVFDPNDEKSIIDAIYLGLKMNELGLGEKNREYASCFLRTSVVSEKLYGYYLETIEE